MACSFLLLVTLSFGLHLKAAQWWISVVRSWPLEDKYLLLDGENVASGLLEGQVLLEMPPFCFPSPVPCSCSVAARCRGLVGTNEKTSISLTHGPCGFLLLCPEDGCSLWGLGQYEEDELLPPWPWKQEKWPLRIRKDEMGWSGNHREKELHTDILNLCTQPWSLQSCAHVTLSWSRGVTGLENWAPVWSVAHRRPRLVWAKP